MLPLPHRPAAQNATTRRQSVTSPYHPSHNLALHFPSLASTQRG